MENGLTPFENNGIRKMIHDDEWYFSVIDVIEVLTDSPMPKRYWTDLKRRSEKESGQGYAFCVPLKMIAKDGRSRLTDCANTQGILRIIMSVPSPKAEPLKLWLAEQGKRTIDETENPELLTQRQIDLYKAKGYPEEWIKRRMESIQTRNLLTDEWQKRGVEKGTEYSV
jgi:DNA-damage-inducible protein D